MKNREEYLQKLLTLCKSINSQISDFEMENKCDIGILKRGNDTSEFNIKGLSVFMLINGAEIEDK